MIVANDDFIAADCIIAAAAAAAVVLLLRQLVVALADRTMAEMDHSNTFSNNVVRPRGGGRAQWMAMERMRKCSEWQLRWTTPTPIARTW